MDRSWRTEVSGEADFEGVTIGTMGSSVFGIMRLPIYSKDLKSTLRMMHLKAHEWTETFFKKEENMGRSPEAADDDSENLAGAHELKDELKIISSEEWKAKIPRSDFHRRTTYYKSVVICIALFKDSLSLDNCSILLQETEDAKGRLYNNNFVVGPDGLVYEGLGWDYFHKINDIFVIKFALRNIEEIPSRKAVAACKMLIQKGVNLGKIVPFYTVISNPCARLTEEVESWEL